MGYPRSFVLKSNTRALAWPGARLPTLVIALCCFAVAPAHAQTPLDLNGEWTTGNGERVRIRHSGPTVRATLVSGAGCLFGGSRSYFLEGQLQGSSLRGTMQRCSGPEAEKLITDCGEQDPWTTTFEATADTLTISGTYFSEGWAYDTKEGRWVNCRRDDAFSNDISFTLTRKCAEDEIWDRIYAYCHEAEARHQQNAAAIREQEAKFDAAFKAASDRFFSLKILGFGAAKAGAKFGGIGLLNMETGTFVKTQVLGNAAKAVALRIVFWGGVAYLLIEAGHASKDLEDAHYALDAILEMLEQSTALNEACIAALGDLEACEEEIEKERERDAERRRAEERQEELRRQAEELLEYSGRYGQRYEDAQGNVYLGQDALKAALRDLERQQQDGAGGVDPSGIGQAENPLESRTAPVVSPEEALRTLIRDALKEVLSRPPTPEDVLTLEQEIQGVSDADLERVASENATVGHVLRAAKAFGAATDTLGTYRTDGSPF